MRTYLPYHVWEDWQAGMWRPFDDEHVDSAVALLSDAPALSRAMARVVKDWPNATSHNLTDRSSNRRAWLGQAACLLLCGSPEGATRMAWGILDQPVRDAANAVAERVIDTWDAGGVGCQRNIWT